MYFFTSDKTTGQRSLAVLPESFAVFLAVGFPNSKLEAVEMWRCR